jgi:hypothetical protein
MINLKVETLMENSSAFVFPKRAGGWCEPVKNAFESTPELHGDISHCRFKCRYVMKRIGLSPINQGGNAGSSRPFYQGTGAIFVVFFH